jgi:hypothetical protein
VSRSLFDLVVRPDRASPLFMEVQTRPGFQAARRLMDELFAKFHDIDHSFVREFQSGGFSARIFELALFGYLYEQGYELNREHSAPDFVVLGSSPVAIEATTSNPAQGVVADAASTNSGRLTVPEDVGEEERKFIFQAGKALRHKLTKKDSTGRAYWEQPHISNMPFVVALQTFHNDSALYNSVGSLALYLYGRRDVVSFDVNGRLNLVGEPIDRHYYGEKSIPSGLFAMPEAEHLSGVLFSNSGTVPKFHRIGTERGYGVPDVTLARVGTVVDPDPNATEPHLFGYVVEVNPEEPETFSEGLHLLHNPWARIPAPLGALRDITEHQLTPDGLVLTTGSRLDPLVSRTFVLHGSGAESHAELMVLRFLGLLNEEAE